MPHGLWKVSYKQVLGFLQKEGFNAIRLPFSTAMALDLDKINTTVRHNTHRLLLLWIRKRQTSNSAKTRKGWG